MNYVLAVSPTPVALRCAKSHWSFPLRQAGPRVGDDSVSMWIQVR